MTALFSRRLRCAWTFSPGLPIWRLHPPVNNRIIGEVRNVNAKTATFFALDATTGSCLWRDRELHDAWWVAIERVAGDTLVLHGFSSPDLPVIRGVTVVDIPRCEVIWTNNEWAGDESALADAGVDPSAAGADKESTFPIMRDPLAQEIDRPILAFWPASDLPGPLETAECDRYTIVAGHVRTGSRDPSQLKHMLKVHESDSGKVVYADTLAAAAQGIAPEAFFLHGNMLYYIRERTTLCAVRLRE